MTYHHTSAARTLQALESDGHQGLSEDQARARQARFGKNRLQEKAPKTALRRFLEQFKDLLVVILIVAAIISMVSGNVESTIVIFVVLIINAVLGTAQTLKAEKSLEALKNEDF